MGRLLARACECDASSSSIFVSSVFFREVATRSHGARRRRGGETFVARARNSHVRLELFARTMRAGDSAFRATNRLLEFDLPKATLYADRSRWVRGNNSALELYAEAADARSR